MKITPLNHLTFDSQAPKYKRCCFKLKKKENLHSIKPLDWQNIWSSQENTTKMFVVL